MGRPSSTNVTISKRSPGEGKTITASPVKDQIRKGGDVGKGTNRTTSQG